MFTAFIAAALLSVTAPQLWSDYRKDPVAADARYLGKRLVVLGHIRAISPTYILYLDGGRGQTVGVTAVLATSEIHKGERLKVGAPIALTCTGMGAVFGEPIVLECLIQ